MKPCNLSCFASLVILLTASACCDSSLATSTEPSVTTAINELESRVARDGSFTFRSWEGKSIGMDSDTEITFLPNQTVHMTEYGYVVTGYKGMYRINSKGEVTAKFDDFKHEWPIMLLQKDSISLLLRPKDSLDFVMETGVARQSRAAKEAIGPSDRCPQARKLRYGVGSARINEKGQDHFLVPQVTQKG